MNDIIICPRCRAPLYRVENSAKCSNNHSFDFAKEGYLNLLLGSVGGTHGDNREMLLCRRAFLERGHYAPLRDAMADYVKALTPRGGNLLDIGCGEGYYTAAFSAAVDGGKLYAFDISKEGVRLGAKRRMGAHFCVASAYDMPYADAAFDTVTNLFSPLCPEEIRRTLKSGGHFLMAIPESEHLYELKCVLYDTPYKNEPTDYAIEGLSFLESRRLTYRIDLRSQDEIAALFLMTPYAYRTPREGKARLLSLTELSTTVDFRILVYRKA